METVNAYRRTLLKGALGGAAIQSVPRYAVAQSTIRIRQEWQTFKRTSQYQSFLNGISAMQRNTNPSDPLSLQYWANIHVNNCPHMVPYFIAWHRGFLYYFEQQLRLAAGDPTLNVPYWDWFLTGNIPAEFLDPTPGNPLHQRRYTSTIYTALDLSPFAPTVYNFQRGTSNAFETRLENAPHNPIHNLIGGNMGAMPSPLDPLFFLHHANVDRLTHAWALPDGKGIPLSAYPYSPTNSDIYWAGNHVYASNLSLERYRTLIPTWLGYDYDNNKVPTALPPIALTAQVGATRLPSSLRLPSNKRPAFKSFTPVQGRRISENRRSLGGVAHLALNEESVSLRLNLNKRDAAEAAGVVAARREPRGNAGGRTVGSVKVVLDRAALSGDGARGGYFYALYANMPSAIDSQAARERTFIGTLGSFEIAGASHHGPAKFELDISDQLAQQNLTDLSELALSWVRVDGDEPPVGKVIDIDEVRIELSYETEPVQAPPLPRPPRWYQAASRRGKS
jgi:tyrosinase